MSSGDPRRDRNGTLFQAHPWHGVTPRAPEGEGFNAFIEIVPTDTVKYELDKASGHLRIDRPQRYSSVCPTLYGFIPQSYCGPRTAARCSERTGRSGIEGDCDPIDICVLTEKVISHGNVLVTARPIGGLRMIDGIQADDKIIAVLEADINYGHMRDIADCPPGVLDRLQHYFLTYKQLPGEESRKVTIAEVYDRAEAVEVIERSLVDYSERFGAPEEPVAELRRLIAGGAV
jgi:inorganic pyrophosphatase